MSVYEIEVNAVAPDELLAAWTETGINLPGAELWPPALEAGTNDVLIARLRNLGSRAVGSVCIMWNGPIRVDTVFREVLEANYPQDRIPAVYGLDVNPVHRRLGVGTALMQGVEKVVLQKPEVKPRVALTVAQENVAAVTLYDQLGYARLDQIVVDAPKWNPETAEFDHQDQDTWVMVKDIKA